MESRYVNCSTDTCPRQARGALRKAVRKNFLYKAFCHLVAKKSNSYNKEFVKLPEVYIISLPTVSRMSWFLSQM